MLAELLDWTQGAGWGVLSASGLLTGAVGGYYTLLPHAAIARAMTFAAGAILALVSETMIPEAFHGAPHFNGLLLVVGFAALLILVALSHSTPKGTEMPGNSDVEGTSNSIGFAAATVPPERRSP
jgi:zinc transporter ZupT